MDIVEELIHQFIKLRSISLPHSVRYPQFLVPARNILEESTNRSEEPVMIKNYFMSSRRCLFQLV